MSESNIKVTRSERQAGKPSASVAEQRIRILTALSNASRGGLPMSAMAYAAFPDYKFRSAQGAALAVSRTVRGMYDDGLIRGRSRGYEISQAWQQALADARSNAEAKRRGQTMNPARMIEVALNRALKAYAGKTDRGGKAYILHPLRMMLHFDDPISQCVALLHDVVEDDPESSIQALREDGFPEVVIATVDDLTRRPGETYEDYITRVRRNPIARKVKIKDFDDNMNLSRLKKVSDKDFERIQKYHHYRKLLISVEDE